MCCRRCCANADMAGSERPWGMWRCLLALPPMLQSTMQQQSIWLGPARTLCGVLLLWRAGLMRRFACQDAHCTSHKVTRMLSISCTQMITDGVPDAASGHGLSFLWSTVSPARLQKIVYRCLTCATVPVQIMEECMNTGALRRATEDVSPARRGRVAELQVLSLLAQPTLLLLFGSCNSDGFV